MVLLGVDPFVRVIPKLLFALGIWKRTFTDPGKDPIVLRILLVDDTPHQQNGHVCGIFIIKYTEYILCDDIKSMPMNFDASRARLDIATRLFKHNDIKKPTQLVQSTGESIVIE
ncbi:Hypothetical predicted protein [Olea europaea subsp. europaea]|uniref:Ubiquitin-like protease family profile domain-containing protein n=1 Tax=Olea europaea subsp. europaea TaxID=158383 RepID=A0A8S0R2R5_OLEEU|nr:Hypothetical predicted protein [Olea europaea subsp. europaea]